MGITAEEIECIVTTLQAPRRHVRIGQTWRRRDPSGAFVEFKVVGFLPRNGIPNATVRGRTRKGRVIVSPLGFVQTDERFELVSDPGENQVPTKAKKPRRYLPGDWRSPAGTPVILTLDDGSTVECKTTSRSYATVGGRGVVDLTYGDKPWCLSRVRVDRSRELTPGQRQVLLAVCAATAKGQIYVPSSGGPKAIAAERAALNRARMREFVERIDGGFRAMRAAFEILELGNGGVG